MDRWNSPINRGVSMPSDVKEEGQAIVSLGLTQLLRVSGANNPVDYPQLSTGLGLHNIYYAHTWFGQVPYNCAHAGAQDGAFPTYLPAISPRRTDASWATLSPS